MKVLQIKNQRTPSLDRTDIFTGKVHRHFQPIKGRHYSTNNIPNPKDPKQKRNGTWTEWYNENVYPFFTEDYYYVGYGVVLMAAVGAGLGGYHAYQWWNSSSTNNYTPPSPPMNSNTTSDALTQNTPLEKIVGASNQDSIVYTTTKMPFNNPQSNPYLDSAWDKVVAYRNTMTINPNEQKAYKNFIGEIMNYIRKTLSPEELDALNATLGEEHQIFRLFFNTPAQIHAEKVQIVANTVINLDTAMSDALLTHAACKVTEVACTMLDKSDATSAEVENQAKNIYKVLNKLISITEDPNQIEIYKSLLKMMNAVLNLNIE